MRISALKYSALTVISRLSMLILLLVPFQGFLTVYAAHLFGHYTVIRLWDEAILAICVIGVLYLLLTDRKIRINTLGRHLVWIILSYIALNLVLGVVSYHNHDVTAKALGYGLIVNLRYIIFFLITWSITLRMTKLRTHWQQLILWPATVVVIFGLLQIFVLPHDFLKHFGYGLSTIPVMETINHNSNYIRIASTLRGANPLGAYLIIPITLLVMLILKGKRSLHYYLLLIGSLIALIFSFSRSAWLGVGLSLISLLLILKLNHRTKKIFAAVGLALVIVIALGFIVFRNNTNFQNFVFHTQTHSSVKTTSDEGHLSGLKSGIKDIIHEPLGKGPGTAGPASIYNANKTRINENYFIQLGQETGWLGLALFLLINLGVGYLLWLRRADPLALCLFASLIGISVVNLLLYGWSDDSLAYIWWGLAGLAMVPISRTKTGAASQ